MPDVNTAEPSPAIVLSELPAEDLQKWRETGNVPDKPKPQDSAPAEPPKEATSEPEGESAAEPESATPQEKGKRAKPGAEERIKQLIAKNKELEKQLAERTRTPEAAAQPPVNKQPQGPRSEPKLDDVTEDGKPKYASYEDWLADLRKYDREQILADVEQRSAHQAAEREMKAKVEEGKSRYSDFEETIRPVATTLLSDVDIPLAVKQFVNDSPYMMDLLYVIGSDQDALADFMATAKSNPNAALRKAAVLENEVMKELTAKKEPPKEEVKPPAPPKTAAPKPPAEVGGRGTVPDDPIESAVKNRDYRAASAEWTRRALAGSK